MSSNVIVIGRLASADVAGVIGVVRDWTASGLLRPSNWINLETPERVLRITSAGEKEFALNDWIAQGASDISIYVVQPLRNPDSLISYSDIQKYFNDIPSLANELPKLVNVLVPTDQAPSFTATPFFLQQLNYVAEPVDGFMPNDKAVQVTAKSGFYSQHAAKELATVAGLWPGQSEPALANELKPVGLHPDVIVGRSFLRYVDASSLVTSATDQLVSEANDSLPVPTNVQSGTPMPKATANELSHIKIAVDSFIEAHPELKFKKTWPEFRSKVDGLSFMQSLTRFLKWAMKKTPELLLLTLQRKVDELKLKVAAPVQGLYGFESRVAVIVGGVTAHKNPDGTALSGAEILAQLSNSEFEAASATPGAERIDRAAPANPGNLWRDFIEATVGIADGSPASTGNSGVVFPTEGTRRMVITNPDFIAPNVAKDTFEIPVNVTSSFKGRKLTPEDPLVADLVLLELAEMQKNRRDLSPADRGQLATLQNKLSGWITSNNSFVWKVGQAVSAQINTAVSAWSTLVNESNIDVAPMNEAVVHRKNDVVDAYKRFFAGSKYIAGAGGLVWLGQALWLYFTTHAWPVLAGNWWAWALLFVGVLTLWNLLGPLVIWDELKALHIAENAIDDRKEKLKYIENIRGSVWGEVYRLNSLYGQYLAWSAIVSPFIHREKSAAENLSGGKLTMPKSLPNSMTLAVIDSDIGSATALAKSLQAGAYSTGWLYQTVDNAILAAGYGASVWSDMRTSENSELARLARTAKTSDFRGLISDGSRIAIQGMAGSSATYRNASVRVPTAIDSNRSFTGVEFIADLAKGELSLPASPIFSPLALGKRNIDQARSVLFVDGNMTVNSDITVKQSNASQTIAARKLDFMAIRFEATKVLSPQDLTFEIAVDSKPEAVVDREDSDSEEY